MSKEITVDSDYREIVQTNYDNIPDDEKTLRDEFNYAMGMYGAVILDGGYDPPGVGDTVVDVVTDAVSYVVDTYTSESTTTAEVATDAPDTSYNDTSSYDTSSSDTSSGSSDSGGCNIQ